jgi:signal transduction histidine kinase
MCVRSIFQTLLEKAQLYAEQGYRVVKRYLRKVGGAIWVDGGSMFIPVTGNMPAFFAPVFVDITESKRAEEMQAALAREREMFAQQRAAEVGRANEALRGCLDALASVPHLDEFLGQVMAAITRQLGASSSVLRLNNFEQNSLDLELVFQDGRIMSAAEANYPKQLRCTPLDERELVLLRQPALIIHLLHQTTPIPEVHRSYLLKLGFKTLLIIRLTIARQLIGSASFQFTEDREFRPDEIEIARALATQASLAIHLTRLAEAGRQAAVLEERNRLAGEIHDSLAQTFAAIAIQLNVARDVIQTKEGDGLRNLERAKDLARFGQKEAHRSALGLHPPVLPQIGLTEAARILVERSNVPGRLQCTLDCSDSLPDNFSPEAQHNLLRIAQEAIGNAVRHANPTTIRVSLQCDHNNFELEVRDNGDGIPAAQLQSQSGFGLLNMRNRAKKLGATFDLRTGIGDGTSIVVRIPIYK